MVTVPVAIPVTIPLLSTVAMEVLEEVQGLVAAGVPEPFRSVVAPTQTVSVPVMFGRFLTVTFAVLLHPALLV